MLEPHDTLVSKMSYILLSESHNSWQ